MESILRGAALCGLIGTGILAAGCGGERRERPDVLVLVIDTLRADRLGCYGYPRPTSPHLDRLAAEGVLFERASAQSSWTLPSMSSMLAGRYLTAHRSRPDPEHVLLAESFQAAGYRTIGIAANTLLRAEDGFARGFDLYHLCERGENTYDDVLAWLDQPLADAAAARDEHGRREPLFLYVHVFDPHAPYVRHAELDAELPPAAAPGVATPEWQRAELAKRGPPPPAGDPDWRQALAELKRRRGLYDQEVRYSDERTGALLRRLDDLGLRERMIVAVVADHGEGLWEHVSRMAPEKLREAAPDTFFFGSHGQDLSEQALRTPFLLHGPGIPAGRRIAAPVENVDLYPTLCQLADLAAPAGLHGRSLVPLIEDAVPWRDESFSYVIHAASLRDEARGLKIVVPTDPATGAPIVDPSAPDTPIGGMSVIELYDLRADPRERENVARSRAADVERLVARVQDWIARYPTRRSTPGDVDTDLEQRLQELGYAGALVGEDEHDDDPDGGH